MVVAPPPSAHDADGPIPVSRRPSWPGRPRGRERHHRHHRQGLHRHLGQPHGVQDHAVGERAGLPPVRRRRLQVPLRQPRQLPRRARAAAPVRSCRGGQGVLAKELPRRPVALLCLPRPPVGQLQPRRRGGRPGITTQTAFWTGKALRASEPRHPGAQHPRLRGGVPPAARSPFNVYAMGHTHVALLTEVVIAMEPEPPPPDPMPIGP